MKKTTILNAPLSAVIAEMGHTDGLVVCDAGLPIPLDADSIDLALTKGVPGFLQVSKIIAEELFIERALIADEMASVSPALYNDFLTFIQEVEKAQGRSVKVDSVPHEEFKSLTYDARAVVRTGECTPYANVIFYSGVPF